MGELFGQYTKVAEEYQRQDAEAICQYEEHYMRLLRNYAGEIRDIQSMMESLRKERENFYREMLRMFCAQGREKRAEIASLYERENWPDYAVKVHALKSTSLTIGAEALSAQAKELELAGKRGDGDFIQAHHGALMNAYEELCGQLAGI